MSEHSERVLVEPTGFVATLTLNRPQKLNAIDPAMLEAIEDALDRVESSDEIRVLLIRGAGERAFCVGADVNAWAALEPIGMWAHWVRRGHRVFDRLARLRQPTIAVLHGYTFGGGLELALAADLRLAATGVELGQPETKLATTPGWAGSLRLPALIGPGRAKQMIFSGARVDATTAERWGLVNEVVSREQLLDRALALAAEIAGNAPVAVQLAKQMIDGGSGLGANLALESMAGALSASTADGREGVAAFREKRPARYTGVRSLPT
jgi:enoyl-CoA hydratase/carnithine racemase